MNNTLAMGSVADLGCNVRRAANVKSNSWCLSHMGHGDVRGTGSRLGEHQVGLATGGTDSVWDRQHAGPRQKVEP